MSEIMLTLFHRFYIISPIFYIISLILREASCGAFLGPPSSQLLSFEHFLDCDIQNALHNSCLKNKTSCSLKIKQIISLIVFTLGLGGTFSSFLPPTPPTRGTHEEKLSQPTHENKIGEIIFYFIFKQQIVCVSQKADEEVQTAHKQLGSMV